MATGQAQALAAMPTVYGELQTLQAAIAALKPLGLTADWASTAYDQDLADFRAADGAPAMTTLAHQISAQMSQLTADNVQAGPYVASAVLKQMQADITTLKGYGVATDAFQATYAADTKTAADARTPANYLALLTTLADHRQVWHPAGLRVCGQRGGHRRRAPVVRGGAAPELRQPHLRLGRGVPL